MGLAIAVGQLAIITILLYRKELFDPLLILVTSDGIFDGISTLVKSIQGLPLESPGAEQKTYKLALFRRYLFYLILRAALAISRLILWGYCHNYANIAACLMAHPILFNRAMDIEQISNLLEIICGGIRYYFRNLIFVSIAKCLNILSTSVIGRDPNFNKLIIADNLKIITYDYAILFLKLIAAGILIDYTGARQGIIKTAISYIARLPIDNQKSLDKYIKSGDVTQLLDLEVMIEVIAQYKTNCSKNTLVQVKSAILRLQWSAARFSAIYGLYYLFELNYLIPAISIAIVIFSHYEFWQKKIKISFRILGGICGVLAGNEIITAFLCEFLEYLYNPATKWLAEKILIQIKNNSHKLAYHNQYNMQISTTVLALLFLRDSTSICIILSPFLYANRAILAYFIIFGYLSQYNAYHMICLGIILYIFVNVANIKKAPPRKLNISIIDEYIDELSPIARDWTNLPPPDKIDEFEEIAETSPNDIMGEFCEIGQR